MVKHKAKAYWNVDNFYVKDGLAENLSNDSIVGNVSSIECKTVSGKKFNCVVVALWDADGSYTCRRCQKLFAKLRQLTSHKCQAVSVCVNDEATNCDETLNNKHDDYRWHCCMFLFCVEVYEE